MARARSPDRRSCYRTDREPQPELFATSLPADFPRRELILELARRLSAHPAVERVWLCGSRARGDNFERSDIDLAIEAPRMDRYDWLNLSLDFEDDAPTLLGVDLMRVEELPNELREDLQSEGIVIYERTRASEAEERSRAGARPSGGGAAHPGQ